MDPKLEEGGAGLGAGLKAEAAAIAVPAEVRNTVLPAPEAVAPVRAREMGGERTVAMVLRAGAVLGGASFLLSLPLELLPPNQYVHTAIDLLRKAGASFLIVTPVARLGVAGTLLGLKGEWRYLLYAAVSVGLLLAAVGAGLAT